MLDAQATFENHIRNNPYPGRGLVVGRDDRNGFVFIYWIMGRSQNSRNRRFAILPGGTLRTEPVDPALVEDPRLIIYEAMLELPHVHLVSNGDQTTTLQRMIDGGATFEAALATREREPDAPNYTPRISGMLDFRQGDPLLALNILKAAPHGPEHTNRFTYRPALPPAGLGYGITTYMGDGNPLPSFSGEPLLLPCTGSPEELLSSYFDALNADNRISVAVKRMAITGQTTDLVVRNRYES